MPQRRRRPRRGPPAPPVHHRGWHHRQNCHQWERHRTGHHRTEHHRTGNRSAVEGGRSARCPPRRRPVGQGASGGTGRQRGRRSTVAAPPRRDHHPPRSTGPGPSLRCRPAGQRTGVAPIGIGSPHGRGAGGRPRRSRHALRWPGRPVQRLVGGCPRCRRHAAGPAPRCRGGAASRTSRSAPAPAAPPRRRGWWSPGARSPPPTRRRRPGGAGCVHRLGGRWRPDGTRRPSGPPARRRGRAGARPGRRCHRVRPPGERHRSGGAWLLQRRGTAGRYGPHLRGT